MTSTVSDARRAEQFVRAEKHARDLWLDRDLSPAMYVDESGRKVEAAEGDRYRQIKRSARIIAISDGLATAVAGMLADLGVQASVDHVRIDPAEDDRQQVIAVRFRVGPADVVVPIRPGAVHLRAYLASDEILLTGEPVFIAEPVVDPARDTDGWVAASALAAALSGAVLSVGPAA